MFRRKLFAKILVLEKDLQKRKDSEVISFIMAKLEMAKKYAFANMYEYFFDIWYGKIFAI